MKTPIHIILITAAAFAGTLPLLSDARPPGADNGRPPHPPTPEEAADQIMARFDKNKDGKLDLKELTASIRAHQQRHGDGPPPRPGRPESE